MSEREFKIGDFVITKKGVGQIKFIGFTELSPPNANKRKECIGIEYIKKVGQIKTSLNGRNIIINDGVLTVNGESKEYFKSDKVGHGSFVFVNSVHDGIIWSDEMETEALNSNEFVSKLFVGACKTNKLNIVKHLLSNCESKVITKNNSFINGLKGAIEYECNDVFDYLIEYNKGNESYCNEW